MSPEPVQTTERDLNSADKSEEIDNDKRTDR